MQWHRIFCCRTANQFNLAFAAATTDSQFRRRVPSNTKEMGSLDVVRAPMELHRSESMEPMCLPCTMSPKWHVNMCWKTINRASWKRWPIVLAIIRHRTIAQRIGRPKKLKCGKMPPIQWRNYKITWWNAAGGMGRMKRHLWNICENKYWHKFPYRRKNSNRIGVNCSTTSMTNCQNIYSK